ncbi:hypothetical protein RND71_001677 [Anisodus tanguticus]|uniref:Uncharacterized protein n=1 Tax=Anisodus tanguticus TaxID=243964 RepID=A0AAE1T0P0_9SOLA|nr:hypothetical protein RND71_001677 [Anisodus tanguticus]
MTRSTIDVSEISTNDVVGKVLGKEHSGKVRCLGLGVGVSTGTGYPDTRSEPILLEGQLTGSHYYVARHRHRQSPLCSSRLAVASHSQPLLSLVVIVSHSRSLTKVAMAKASTASTTRACIGLIKTA